MKRFLTPLAILLVTLITVVGPALPAEAYVSVKGYYRSNGTYVQPHVRSNPNGLKYDNYGYKSGGSLYNSTYGTRGSTWDTPTWYTDSNYYYGKSLYKSNSYSGSLYGSSLYQPSYNYIRW
jgi:hypothetical protein